MIDLERGRFEGIYPLKLATVHSLCKKLSFSMLTAEPCQSIAEFRALRKHVGPP